MSARLFDPRRADGSFPFEFTRKEATDVRETWDRTCPGWRERKPGNYEQPKVRQIQTRKAIQ